MATENTFQDRIQRSRELLTAVSGFNPVYAPTDTQFTTVALAAAIAVADTASVEVEEKRQPYQDPTADRAALLKTVSPLVTQALAYVKSNTAWAGRYELVKAAADKVRGMRPPKEKKQPEDPATDRKTREYGDRSYVEIAGFLKSYIDRLFKLPGYAPQDEKISIAALRALWTELDGYNRSIPSVAQDLADAIAGRLEAFTGATRLKFVFDGVKTTAKGQYGQASAQYKAISGIKW